MNRSDVYHLVDQERTRQHELWDKWHAFGKGDCSSNTVEPMVKLAVLTEEVGEVAQELLGDRCTTAALRAELVQVAAVAVAWLESLP